MKKLLVITAALALFASPALASIINGPHDLSGLSIGNGTGQTDEVCVFCHTPHAANTAWTITAGVVPLSNRTSTGSTLCMSCHDGNVQYNDMTNKSNADVAGGTDYNFATAGAFGFTYGTSNHPVNVAWNAGGAMQASNTLGVANGANIQCASCHDVHEPAGGRPFLRIDNTDSALCVNCHNK